MISQLSLGIQLGGLSCPVPSPTSWGTVRCRVRMIANAKALSDMPFNKKF